MASTSAHAHSTQSGDIKIGHVWADVATQREGSIDVYLPIYNGGAQADTLVKVTSPAATAIVLVTSQGPQDGVNLPLPPKKPLNLTARKPFLRLTGLTRVWQAGEEIPLTFQFTTAPPASITAHLDDKAGH
jgi:copper(I)-binding protein